MCLLILLILTSCAYADYKVTAKAHCGPVYTIVKDSQGNSSIQADDECVTTPNDWRD